ncbi:hypothetical protein [Shewanella woodyi]|uniref:hypothetical protein n=1 Tax=Shewanella woodyi TaxID=60961 RepID=UPI0007F8D201
MALKFLLTTIPLKLTQKITNACPHLFSGSRKTKESRDNCLYQEDGYNVKFDAKRWPFWG